MTQAREELLWRIGETEAPENDEALCHDICQVLMFDGHGHGCGAFCHARANLIMAGKEAVIARLRALPNDRSGS